MSSNTPPSKPRTGPKPNGASKPSDAIVAGPARAPARAMLRAAGLGDDDFTKPMIAVINTWSSVTPCNMHLNGLAEHVRAGIREAGGVPIDFNTIVVTDGISMGSPELMAADIERFVSQGYHRFQLKVGGDPRVDIERIKQARDVLGPDDILVADANTGWTMRDAIRVVNAVEHLDVHIEQPCRSQIGRASCRERV